MVHKVRRLQDIIPSFQMVHHVRNQTSNGVRAPVLPTLSGNANSAEVDDDESSDWGGPYASFGRPRCASTSLLYNVFNRVRLTPPLLHRLSDFERYREPTLPYGAASDDGAASPSGHPLGSGRDMGTRGRSSSPDSWGRSADPW